jgi:hypothetical protein
MTVSSVKARDGQKGNTMLRAISNWFGRLFGPKDDFKAALLADLGLKR